MPCQCKRHSATMPADIRVGRGGGCGGGGTSGPGFPRPRSPHPLLPSSLFRGEERRLPVADRAAAFRTHTSSVEVSPSSFQGDRIDD
jgi:hypothetical protein